MVGLVLVSHSRALAEALVRLIRQVTSADLPLATAAGVGEDRRELGTDAIQIMEAIQSVYSEAGVVVLMLSLPWGPKVPLAGDYNGDGSVDVLDALALAREESPESMIDSRSDMNKDGVLDRRDADRIADMAVVLWKNGPRDES